MKYERITIDPAICGGKPCICGMRFPVSRLLGLLATGESQNAILSAYPYLELKDLEEVLLYSADLADKQAIEHAPLSSEEKVAISRWLRSQTKGLAPPLTAEERREGLE